MKKYYVELKRGVCVEVLDSANERQIREEATRVANEADLIDLYFTSEDVISIYPANINVNDPEVEDGDKNV